MNDVQDKINYTAQILGLLALAALFIMMISFWGADKPVRSYYLCDNLDNALAICVDIDWDADDRIIVNGMTFDEAVDHIERLNNTLPTRGE